MSQRVWGDIARVVEEVCLRLERGESLAEVCRVAEMPPETTLRAWLRRFPELKARVDGARAVSLSVRQARPLVERVRPVAFHDGLAAALLERLAAASEGLEAVCAAADMPSSATVYRWLADYPDFAASYGQARQVQAHRMFDEARAIARAATDKTVRVAKLRIDTLKWQAAKLAPRVYGARVERDLEPEAPVFNIEIVKFGDADRLQKEVDDLRARMAAAGLELPPPSVEEPYL